jgi:hypothetical protein
MNWKVVKTLKASNVIPAFLIVLLIILMVFCSEDSVKHGMDSEEAHYDCDNLILMVDKQNSMIGLYYCGDAIMYDFCDVSAFEGEYSCIPVIIYDKRNK